MRTYESGPANRLRTMLAATSLATPSGLPGAFDRTPYAQVASSQRHLSRSGTDDTGRPR